MILIYLNGTNYQALDLYRNLTVADSFVVPSNKLGTGNGEAKLYIGDRGNNLYSFWGQKQVIKGFLYKDDLLEYLNSVQVFYLERNMLDEWNARFNKVSQLDAINKFEIVEQQQIAGNRVYLNSNGFNQGIYRLLRELPLSNTSVINVFKLWNTVTNQEEYYFKLNIIGIDDPLEEIILSDISIMAEQKIVNDVALSVTEKEMLIKSRLGQGEYRQNLLSSTGAICPFTAIVDSRLLVASHIKPWSKSNNFERLDPFNGFVFTPTFDKLFDRGYISFEDDSSLLISNSIDIIVQRTLGICNGMRVRTLPILGRENYLSFHRDNVFKP